MSIEKMLANYKTEAELRAFAEASQKTLMQLMKKNKELTDEVEHLKKLVTGAMPIIKDNASPVAVGTDEEEIARIELRKLKEKSMDSEPLMLEDAKKLEIYSKILNKQSKDKDDKEREVKEIDSSQLLAIVEGTSEELNK
jgi:hypothetical protein